MTTELERIVAAMHAGHYTPENPNGLWKPNESPNTNTIFKIWDDGEITNEKGGDAFGDRSVRTSCPPLVGPECAKPRFPLEGAHNSYAILTYDECLEVRGMLRTLFAPHIVSHVEVRVRTESEEVVCALKKSFRELGLSVQHSSPVIVSPYIFVLRGKGDVAQTVRTGLGGMDGDVYVYD